MDDGLRMDDSTWGRGAAALLAGLALRIVFLHFHPRFLGDTLTYGDLAHNMLAHHVFGFTEDVIRPTLIRLPGYPLFLAACFVVFGTANYVAVLWVQIAIDLGTCALLGVLAARLMGRRAGLAAAWMAALCPFTANYAAAALTETLSLFCVTLGFFGLERWCVRWRGEERWVGWAVVTGGALAAAVLLRPDEGLLAAAIVPGMVWLGLRKRRGLVRGLSPAAVAALAVVLPLGLWAARNWHVFHVVQPLAPRYANDPGETVPYGFQRWYRTWAIDFESTVEVYWNYDGDLLRLADLPDRAFDSPEQFAQTRAVYARYNEESAATPAVDAEFARIAEERVAAHPLRYYVEMPVAREANMWLRPRTELMKLPIDWWVVGAHPRRSVFEIAYAVLNAVYLALAMAGLLWWSAHVVKPRPSDKLRASYEAGILVAMVGFVVLRCLLLLTLDNSEPRYTLECFPMVIVFGSFVFARARSISD